MPENNQILRDGSNQDSRMPGALDPGYVSVEERSTGTLLTYAKQFADYLRYVDSNDVVNGEWTELFNFDDQDFEEFVALAENPDLFANDPSKQAKYDQPHRMLFFTFLNLVKNPKNQFDALTKRHLDYYYRTVLQIMEKAGVPDKLHAVLKPVQGQAPHLVEAGRLLDAAKDSAGNPLVYSTDDQIVVNQAKVGDVKTTYVKNIQLDFLAIYNRYQNRVDYSLTDEQKVKDEIGFYKAAGFNDVFRWAFSEIQGGFLTNLGDAMIDKDYESIIEPDDSANNDYTLQIPIYYLGENLHLADVQTYVKTVFYFENLEDFKFCFNIFKWDFNQGPTSPTDEHWEQVWEIIGAAFERRKQKDYANLLEWFETEEELWFVEDLPTPPWPPGVNETEERFDRIMRTAFGYPESGRDLPPAPGFETVGIPVREFVSSIYYNPNICGEDVTIQYPWVEAYVTTNLYMTIEDFKRLMITKERPEPSDDDPTTRVWPDEFYEIVASAMVERKYHPFFRPINDVVATTVAEGEPGKPAELVQFHPFAEVPDENSALESIGFAITSPLLNLAEGGRTVTARFLCKPNSFDYRVIETLTIENPITDQAFLPFDLYVSSEDKWLKVLPYSVRMGWIILEKFPNTVVTDDNGNPVTFTGQLNDTLLICDCEDGPELESGDNFLTQEGNVYEVIEPVSADQQSYNVKQLQKLMFIPETPNLLTNANTFAKLKIKAAHIPPLWPTDWKQPYVDTYDAYEDDRQFFEVTFDLDKEFPPITPFVEGAEVTDIESIHSIMKLELKKLSVMPFNARHPSLCNQSKQLVPDEAQTYTLYHEFRNLQLERVELTVDVREQENVLIANDAGALKPGAPFAPFGLRPTLGSSLYFGSRELCQKKLDTLTLSLEWKDLPDNLNTYYSGYDLVDAVAADPSKMDTLAFRGQLECLVKGNWTEVKDGSKRLFSPELRAYHSPPITDDQQTVSILDIAFDRVGEMTDYHVRLFPLDEEYEAPNELPRYFRFGLWPNDFLHKYYPIAQRNAILGNCSPPPCAGDALPDINEPYLPMLKKFVISYTASAVIDFEVDEDEDVCDINDKLIQIHPFGHLYTWPVEPRYDLNTTASLSGVDNNIYYLMPQFDADGYLYLGFWDLLPSQSLSLLFKPIVFTGVATYTTPEIDWHSLYLNYWDRFHPNNVSDTTRGLVTEGITKFILTSTVDDQNRILPAGRRWIMGSVKNVEIDEIGEKSINALAIPELLNIWPQAVRATFVDQNNAADHLTLPLTAESVKGFVDSDPIIESVTQPYSSFGGRPAETGDFFYRRVAERLRHKDRGITIWDLEHLVLEQFPGIYNAKCLGQQEMSRLPTWAHEYVSAADADVTVVVIPDIANTAPLFPLTPTLPQYRLDEIKEYLEMHTSPFVNLKVKNPRYEHIKYAFKVRFNEGVDPNYHLVQINEDLKAFLSPWAYKKHASISFGSKIYNAKVIHFLDSLSYVDYILDFILWIEREDSLENPGEIRYSPVDDVAITRYPDSILVSAEQHDIEAIEEGAYSKPEGIGYMEIEKDFFVYSHYS